MKCKYDPAKIDVEKLAEIQGLAILYNKKLCNDPNGALIREKKGFLLQGNCYARSNKIYFGINPKVPEPEFLVDPIPENGPWEVDARTGKSLHPELPYWRHCAELFGSDTSLYNWISNATSTFIVPWGTLDLNELCGTPLTKQILKFSRKIVLKIIEHHDSPRIIIAVGKYVREQVQDFLDLSTEFSYEMSPENGERNYGRNIYQWGKTVCDGIAIYQIPHLSGASSHRALHDCASWLVKEIDIQ